jgi:hypothetical protein
MIIDEFLDFVYCYMKSNVLTAIGGIFTNTFNPTQGIGLPGSFVKNMCIPEIIGVRY